MSDRAPRVPLAERLGLHRPELRAWALYDWGNSAFLTTIVAAVFPIYFADVAAAGLDPAVATRRYGWITTATMLVAALTAPLLGALADVAGIKKRLLAGFVGLGVGATAGLWFVGQGQWLLGGLLFALANLGAVSSFVFYDALLPHVARADELDRVSTAGYALGYLGGGLLLALNLAWILRPAWFGLPSGEGLTADQATLPVRLAFLSVALWWLVFTLPLLRRVREPARLGGAAVRGGAAVVRASLRRLGGLVGELRKLRHAFLMMLAFLVYNDGVGTIIRMGAIYGRELGLSTGALTGAILMVQFVGVPCAFLFGALARRAGAKRSVLLGLAVYGVATLVAWRMTSATEFWVLAVLVALVQGGTQALSRSLFASLVPRHKSGEFFGLFAVFEKFAGILGPLLFALSAEVFGSSRSAILSVLSFFVLGAALLLLVDVEAGRRAARAAEAEASASGTR